MTILSGKEAGLSNLEMGILCRRLVLCNQKEFFTPYIDDREPLGGRTGGQIFEGYKPVGFSYGEDPAEAQLSFGNGQWFCGTAVKHLRRIEFQGQRWWNFHNQWVAVKFAVSVERPECCPPWVKKWCPVEWGRWLPREISK